MLERRVGQPPGVNMTDFDWAIVVGVCALLAGDAGWSELRDWLARRHAIRAGTTLTTKFGLPWL